MQDFVSFIYDLEILFRNHWRVCILLLLYVHLCNRLYNGGFVRNRIKVTIIVDEIISEGTYIRDILTRKEIDWLDSVKETYLNKSGYKEKMSQGLSVEHLKNFVGEHEKLTRKRYNFRLFPAVIVPALLPAIIKNYIDLKKARDIKQKIEKECQS